jgi:hypothetical protein
MNVEYIMTAKKMGHSIITNLFGREYFYVFVNTGGGMDQLKK